MARMGADQGLAAQRTQEQAMDFTRQERLDLMEAIREAQGKLCVGPGFPEASAYDARLEALSVRLEQANAEEVAREAQADRAEKYVASLPPSARWMLGNSIS